MTSLTFTSFACGVALASLPGAWRFAGWKTEPPRISEHTCACRCELPSGGSSEGQQSILLILFIVIIIFAAGLVCGFLGGATWGRLSCARHNGVGSELDRPPRRLRGALTTDSW